MSASGAGDSSLEPRAGHLQPPGVNVGLSLSLSASATAGAPACPHKLASAAGGGWLRKKLQHSWAQDSAREHKTPQPQCNWWPQPLEAWWVWLALLVLSVLLALLLALAMLPATLLACLGAAGGFCGHFSPLEPNGAGASGLRRCAAASSSARSREAHPAAGNKRTKNTPPCLTRALPPPTCAARRKPARSPHLHLQE